MIPCRIAADPQDAFDAERWLHLGPGDYAVPVRTEAHPLPRDPACTARTFIVVHRRFGLFTHVYTVLVSPSERRVTVHLRHVRAGETIAEAKAWLLGDRPHRRLAL